MVETLLRGTPSRKLKKKLLFELQPSKMFPLSLISSNSLYLSAFLSKLHFKNLLE